MPLLMGPISHCFQDMASFLLETRIFLPLPFNLEFQNDPLACLGL